MDLQIVQTLWVSDSTHDRIYEVFAKNKQPDKIDKQAAKLKKTKKQVQTEWNKQLKTRIALCYKS